MKRYLLICACAVFAGCAGLNAQRRAAKDASKHTAAAETSVAAAKKAGAAKCALKELKNAEVDLQLAKTNLARKDYSLALNMARSAESNADAALKKCEEVKRNKKK